MSLKHLVVKSVEVNGSIYHFREITGAERIELLKGQKVSREVGIGTRMEIDLALNEEQQHKMVLYSVCNEEGVGHFANLKAVQSQSAKLIKKLYAIADEVNDEDGDTAKND